MQVSLFVLGGINGANRSWVPLSCTEGTIRHEALIENSSDINPCLIRIMIRDEIVFVQFITLTDCSCLLNCCCLDFKFMKFIYLLNLLIPLIFTN